VNKRELLKQAIYEKFMSFTVINQKKIKIKVSFKGSEENFRI